MIKEQRLKNAQTPLLHIAVVGGSASDFEKELYALINRYVDAGLKKPDLIHKMEYVTQSCRVS
jgi:hypothetical protein